MWVGVCVYVKPLVRELKDVSGFTSISVQCKTDRMSFSLGPLLILHWTILQVGSGGYGGQRSKRVICLMTI